MKNPLNKRILREIKGEFGKYVVIFLFMTALIGIVSALPFLTTKALKSTMLRMEIMSLHKRQTRIP